MVAPTRTRRGAFDLTTVAIATWLPAEHEHRLQAEHLSWVHLISRLAALVMQRGRGASLASMVAGAVRPEGVLSGRGGRRHEATDGWLILDLTEKIGQRLRLCKLWIGRNSSM